MNDTPSPPSWLTDLLADWYTPPEAMEWFNAPHPQLGGKSARQAIEEGREADVRAVINRLNDGAYL